ncbi:ankyrin repeat protein [Cotia virus SPAn232]|uniref:Ankyrin repeat protein n=2 Tax=Cotia virus TaxID=39444 RepID=H6TAH5_9POXV|nr:ankyrin repeat protein [Cotia virus SPAn232]AFB76912.1 ankyrin repeat protein [Cotia virus SPAn232]AIT70637.1 ankyrin repeat protein [Cotia virus]
MSSKGGSSGGMWSVFIHGHDGTVKGSKTYTSLGGGGVKSGVNGGVNGGVSSGTRKI